MGSQQVAVLAAEGAVGTALVDGLAARGLSVLPVSEPSEVPVGVRAVIDAGPVATAPAVDELVSLDGAAWESSAEAPLRRALYVLRETRRRIGAGGGRFVVLLPSLVTTGAPGVVPWVAASEGYRSLAKAAARAWGPDGVTVNCVLIPADLVAGASLDRPGLQPPALGRGVNVGTDVASVVVALVEGDLAGLTGQTIAVDGGVWMTP